MEFEQKVQEAQSRYADTHALEPPTVVIGTKTALGRGGKHSQTSSASKFKAPPSSGEIGLERTVHPGEAEESTESQYLGAPAKPVLGDYAAALGKPSSGMVTRSAFRKSSQSSIDSSDIIIPGESGTVLAHTPQEQAELLQSGKACLEKWRRDTMASELAQNIWSGAPVHQPQYTTLTPSPSSGVSSKMNSSITESGAWLRMLRPQLPGSVVTQKMTGRG